MFQKDIFSARLLALRKDKSLSQQALADHLGVSFHQVSKMETGQRGASVEVIAALSDFFDVPADFLLGLKPFEHWEALQPHMDDLRAQTAKIFDLPPALVANASLPEFIRLFGALYARAEISPSDGSVALYPLLPPRA